MATDLTIEPFCLGAWQTNCYVVHAGRDCWVIDAGFDPGPMLDYLSQHGLTPSKVVLTHAHVDHIAGLSDVRVAYPDVPILIHEDERGWLGDPTLNLSIALAEPLTAPPATGVMRHGDELQLSGLAFEVRHTPGHSPGGVTLYQPDHHVALVGDALFAGSVGRVDFPTSDPATLIRSIQEQLYTLPDDTRVLPGHMEETTIGREKATNPYVRA